jgi:hypothetical protein
VREVPAAGEPNDCACALCREGGGAERLRRQCSSLTALGEALLCPKIIFAERQEASGLSAATDEYMHYAQQCVDNACTTCSSAKKMPDCKHLRHSDAPAQWDVFDTVVIANGVKHNDQVVVRVGTVAELWGAFVDFFHNIYVPHNSKARLQHHNFKTCLATFDTDTVVCSADFAEKYSHTSTVEVTCQTKPKSTLMILVAHMRPRLERHPQTDKEQRVHDTVAYVVFSDDEQHDAEFHRHAMNLIVTDIKHKAKIPLKHLVLWTDGCGAQYKGKKNFKFISGAERELNTTGLVFEHNFFATAHGKGESARCTRTHRTMMRTWRHA